LSLPDEDVFLDVKLVTDVTNGCSIGHDTDDVDGNKNVEIDLVLLRHRHFEFLNNFIIKYVQTKSKIYFSS